MFARRNLVLGTTRKPSLTSTWPRRCTGTWPRCRRTRRAACRWPLGTTLWALSRRTGRNPRASLPGRRCGYDVTWLKPQLLDCFIFIISITYSHLLCISLCHHAHCDFLKSISFFFLKKYTGGKTQHVSRLGRSDQEKSIIYIYIYIALHLAPFHDH